MSNELGSWGVESTPYVPPELGPRAGLGHLSVGHPVSQAADLIFAGDPGALCNNGDPDFSYGPQVGTGEITVPTPYTLTIQNTFLDNVWTDRLVWTFPYYPGHPEDQDVLGIGEPVIGVFLQRSTTSIAQPNLSSTYYVTALSAPAADPDWTTIHTWGPYATFLDAYNDLVANPSDQLDSSSEPYDVVTTAPTLFYAYRLIMILGPDLLGDKHQLDWNVVATTAPYVLTGTKNGSTVDLAWTDPQDAFYDYFTIERSNSTGIWEMVYGDGGAFARIPGNVNPRAQTGLVSASRFRVKGYLTNGLVMLHNEVITPSDNATPRAQILRNFGANHGSSGSGFIPYKIAVDSLGNVIFAGLMYGTANAGAGNQAVYGGGGQDCFIAKYNPFGVCLWSRNYGNVSNDKFQGLCVDSSDNIYVIGTVSGGVNPGPLDFHFGTGLDATFSGPDIVVAKFGPNADLIWHKIFGGDGSDLGRGIVADSNGDVYITGMTGFFGSGADFGGGALVVQGRPSAFLAKLRGIDGAHIWSKAYGNNNDGSFGIDVKIASDGNVVLGGEFQGSANWGPGSYLSGGGTDAAIVKVNAITGATIWVHKISGTSDNRMNCLATSTGKIFAVGTISTGGVQTYNGAHSDAPLDGGSLYLLQIDNSGVYVSSAAFGSDISGPVAFGVAASDLLGAVVTGEMITGIDFGQGWLLGNGSNQVFLLRFNPDLTVAWSRRGHSPTLGSSGAGIVISGGQIYCVSSGAVDGFEGYSGPGQPTVYPPITTINTLDVDNNAFWVRFSP